MTDRKLSAYRGKRNFEATQEPSGAVAVAPGEALRFVVQKHDATRLHYDLRLELDGTFKSWAVTRGPSLDPSEKRLAVEVEDHPLDYGDFEGTIPKGQYGGGTVMIWDRGTWTPEQASAEAALAEGDLKFTLHGRKLNGSWVLVRMKHDRTGGKRTNWLLIKHRDAEVREGEADRVLDDDRSVASGRPMQDIEAGRGRKPSAFMTKASAKEESVQPKAEPKTKAKLKPKPAKASSSPAFIEPQLCTSLERPPSGDDWVHEVKLDGYRLQLRVEAGQAHLRTRKGLDWTPKFGAMARAAASLPDCIIDGEVVALDHNGSPDFAALQVALSDESTDDLVFFAFDLLFEGSEDLRTKPLDDRKTRLSGLLSDAGAKGTSSLVRYVEHFTAAGSAILLAACRMSLEGIVSKRLGAAYKSGRSETWTKAKCRGGQEVVIGGWAETNGAFRSLLVGAHRGSGLVYLGRVGTGFGRDMVKRIMPALQEAASTRNPFEGRMAPKAGRDVHWLRPDLVAEIQFAGWTADGMVRQASFKALRRDKPAEEVEAEQPAAHQALAKPIAAKAEAQPKEALREVPRGKAVVMGVPISHPEKILWPANAPEPDFTKLDLARYLEAVGSTMLPHIQARPCSLVRAPDGIGGELFFQRHAMPGTSSLLTLVTVTGDRKPYLAVEQIEGLAALAQVAASELHPSNCRPHLPETPGRLIFDLDPAPELPFSRVIEAAKELRERLNRIGLVAFVKTTGGKGLHLVTPLAPDDALTWPEAKDFARRVCAEMMADSPERYLVTMSKKAREGKIFLDYLRNDHLSTAVAPYSPRARPGAPVSMPLEWEQVREGLDPHRYTIRTVPPLLKKHRAWDGYDDAARPLPHQPQTTANTRRSR